MTFRTTRFATFLTIQDKTGNVRTNVTFRRVRVTIVVVKKKYYIFWVCVCILTCPACKAHAPYCHLRHVRLYYIFSHYLIKGTIFGRKERKKERKKVIEHEICVLVFCTTFVRNIFHSENNSARYYLKCALVFYSCHILMKLELSR